MSRTLRPRRIMFSLLVTVREFFTKVTQGHRLLHKLKAHIWFHMCMLKRWLEWYKWMLTNFDHDRQWFNTLIPPSHESATAVTVDYISRSSGRVRLALRYTTVDIHCRDRRYEWDGRIIVINCNLSLSLTVSDIALLIPQPTIPC